MSLAPGTRIGSHEIIGPIGAGGMGEVYSARDTRLHRDVAIKVLPASFAADVSRRTRFEHEAQAVAALSHPNILSIFETGTHDGQMFVVMELLEGETLRARLQVGSLPIKKAVDIAIQIARGLGAAHDKHLVHRDLKPENVFLVKDGQVKILDFGLAKHSAQSSGGTETAFAMTNPGTVLGSVGYMSPEQSRGLATDGRTDLFALGALLYEMAGGQPAFRGDTAADVMSASLREDPVDVKTLRPDVPDSLARIIRRCLEKNPAERYQNARDLAFALEAISGSDSGSRVAARPAFRVDRRVLAWAFAGLAVGAAATTMVDRRSARPSNNASGNVARALLSVAPAEALARTARTAVALSPDGRTLVFTATRDGKSTLYLRSLDRLDAVAIEGTDGSEGPFFSPDGHWVGYWSAVGALGDGEIKKVSVLGGPPVTLCKTPRLFGASWGSDDRIIFANQAGGLWRISAADGSSKEQLTTIDPHKETSHRLPHVLPGAHAVIFTVQKTRRRWDDATIVVRSLATGEQKVLIDNGSDGQYLPTGHLVFARQGALMAVAFDVDRLVVRGGAVGLLRDVMHVVNAVNSESDTGAAQFSVSNSGTLVYIPGGIVPDTESSLVWIDRRRPGGAVEPFLGPVPGHIYSPRLSPDGQRVVVDKMRMGATLWIKDIARGSFTPLSAPGQNWWAIWKDPTHLTYRSAIAGFENVFLGPVDTNAGAEQLTKGENDQTPGSWTPDGKTLAFVESRLTTDADIWTVSVGNGPATVRPILKTPADERDPEFSPDGHWLAYTSTLSGRNEVYVEAFPELGRRYAISTEGGQGPAWRGHELFYMRNNGSDVSILAVQVHTEPAFSASDAKVLFSGRYGTANLTRGYDVTSDGNRFLMVIRKTPQVAPASQMVMVFNWFEELKRQVPR